VDGVEIVDDGIDEEVKGDNPYVKTGRTIAINPSEVKSGDYVGRISTSMQRVDKVVKRGNKITIYFINPNATWKDPSEITFYTNNPTEKIYKVIDEEVKESTNGANQYKVIWYKEDNPYPHILPFDNFKGAYEFANEYIIKKENPSKILIKEGNAILNSWDKNGWKEKGTYKGMPVSWYDEEVKESVKDSTKDGSTTW
jgi:hypothetical protein